MLHGLQELREQEDRAEHPEEHEHTRDVRRGEAARGKQPHRQHRFDCAVLPDDERGHECDTDGECRDDVRRRPADCVGPDESEHDAEQAGAREDNTGKVEVRRRTAAFVDAQARQRDQRETQRHVEPEDRLP